MTRSEELFGQLEEIHRRPKPFERNTTADLWTDEHISSRMLEFHLDDSVDLSSRKGEFIDRSAAWMASRFGLGGGRAVCDFGCGPGHYTNRLAATGAEVTGIDFSERSLGHAREVAQREGLSIRYVQADYLEYEPEGPFDLVMMIMCDFCALSPGRRRTLLDRFQSCLAPGGSLLFDVHSLHAFDEREEVARHAPNLMDGFWSAKPYFGFLNTHKYEAEKVILDKFTIVEEARTRVVYNWMQCFDRATLGRELEEAGFVVEEWLGDVAGSPFDPAALEFAVVARG